MPFTHPWCVGNRWSWRILILNIGIWNGWENISTWCRNASIAIGWAERLIWWIDCFKIRHSIKTSISKSLNLSPLSNCLSHSYVIQIWCNYSILCDSLNLATFWVENHLLEKWLSWVIDLEQSDWGGILITRNCYLNVRSVRIKHALRRCHEIESDNIIVSPSFIRAHWINAPLLENRWKPPGYYAIELQLTGNDLLNHRLAKSIIKIKHPFLGLIENSKTLFLFCA